MKHTFTQELALQLRDKLSEPNGHRHSPNGYHWSKTENPEWEILHTKTI